MSAPSSHAPAAAARHPNAPVWNGRDAAASRGPFHEVWFLRANEPGTRRALWLRFTLLVSGNGFRRVAEVWAMYADRSRSAKELQKTAVKQTWPIQSFSAAPEASSGGTAGGGVDLTIGGCRFSDSTSHGQVQSKGQSVAWELQLKPGSEFGRSFQLIPESLRKSGLVRNSAVTVYEDLRFTGKVTVNGETFEFKDSPGMQGHLSGPGYGHSWVWAHGASFVDEKGEPASFLFEGVTARGRLLGPLPGPRISSFFFRYRDRDYRFNTLLDTFRLRSRLSQSEWTFQAERDDLSFRGYAKAEHKDFIGLTYEDTNGSLLYCYHCLMAELQIVVYRRGKIEKALYSLGSGSLEIADRVKSPYVPLLL